MNEVNIEPITEIDDGTVLHFFDDPENPQNYRYSKIEIYNEWVRVAMDSDYTEWKWIPREKIVEVSVNS